MARPNSPICRILFFPPANGEIRSDHVRLVSGTVVRPSLWLLYDCALKISPEIFSDHRNVFFNELFKILVTILGPYNVVFPYICPWSCHGIF